MMKKVLLIVLICITQVTVAQKLMISAPVKFLALGDSYTIGESVPQNERWPVQLADELRKRKVTCSDPKIIATTGWRTDQLKAAIANANLKPEYTLVSLLIGVNNQYQGKTVENYAPEFEELLKTAITLAGGDKSRVFVVSIPDYGYTPFGQSRQPAITKGIDAYNAVNEQITHQLGVAYFNITGISRKGFDDPALVAGDGLHPSGKMYKEWVDLILNGSEIIQGNNDEEDEGEVTGIRDEQFGINLYPNPFQNFLILDNLLYLEQPVKFSLIDPTGSIALTREWMQIDSIELDTSLLASGAYNFQLETSSGDKIAGKLLKH
jgi:lysophospholipase L1-like esterase